MQTIASGLKIRLMPIKHKPKLVLDILASKVSLLILGSITVWLGISVAKEAYRKHQVQLEIARLKAEIIAVEHKNSNLASLINSFKEPEVVELEAKKRLNLKKPGEEVAVILRDNKDEHQNIIKGISRETTSEVSSITRSDEESDNLSNPIKWWQYITND